MRGLLEFLIENNQVLEMEGFNNFFKARKNMDNAWGMNFYQKVGVLLSRWLFLMGKSTETLRYSGSIKNNYEKNSKMRSQRPIEEN